MLACEYKMYPPVIAKILQISTSVLPVHPPYSISEFTSLLDPMHFVQMKLSEQVEFLEDVLDTEKDQFTSILEGASLLKRLY